jgi:hypothetical protein
MIPGARQFDYGVKFQTETLPRRRSLDITKRFSGGSQVWDESHFLVRGSNISSDSAAGIGSWSDADFRRLMSEGVRPNGVKVAPQMPFAFYKILTPRDLEAVTAYIRSATLPASRGRCHSDVPRRNSNDRDRYALVFAIVAYDKVRRRFS